ncbi:MAG: hypothetical protein HKN68_16730 [Saprospiraceae bacterium]|nr:hypothetical protein [Saprospiraceae bacterium]
MKYATSIEDYINSHLDRKEELLKLRSLLLETDLTETLKWGMPTYVINKRNIIGIGAFQNWSVLWFHDGALLKDTHKVLVNAQEGKTKGLRQWRFKNFDEIDERLIRQYVAEAIDNAEAGKKVIKNKKKSKTIPKFTIPEILQSKIEVDDKLSVNWQKYTERQKRDLAEYVSEPKRELTREKRLEKVIPIIYKGKPLAAIWAKT